MNKIELYLVKSSSGSYDDYMESYEPIIYATLEAAEKRKQEIIDKHNFEPFPFDWCTESEFEEYRYDEDNIKGITEKQVDIINQWELDNYYARQFNSAWIETIELDLQSWREKQLKGLI
jgi:hypothetical protein